MIQGYYLAAAAFALLVFLLYKEWARKKKSGLYGRLLASIVAVVSLLWMAWPYPEENSHGALKKLVILTDGFIKDSVDDFLQQQHAAIPVYTAAPELGYAGHTTRLIGSWTKFMTEHAADTLQVFGNGFDETTLALLNNHPIFFHAMPAVPAVSSIYWKQVLETGELLLVQGCYQNRSAKKIKILLQAINEGRDSVLLMPGASSTFSLNTLPLHNGKAVYKLLFLSGKDTLQQEPVPVDVQTVAPLQLLIISSAPDFDNTYLKNHLSQKGYQVTLRTAISTNKSETQF